LAARAKGFITGAFSTAPSSTDVPVSFIWGLPKTPLYYTNLIDSYVNHPDAGIAFRYHHNVAVTQVVNLVWFISSVTANPNQFQWKIAGDVTFQASRDVTATTTYVGSNDQCLATKLTGTVPYGPCQSGFEINGEPTSVPAVVGAWETYLIATTQDDTAHQQINYLRYSFPTTSNPARSSCYATEPSDFYYFQFGANGVNDSPICSDRGLCDYSSGTCKCFKGYAGIDCSAQSALSGGTSGGGGGPAAAASA